MARPGKTMREIHLHAVEVLVEELKRMKVLKGGTKQLIEKRAHLPYYPHGTGHWLGMDVHDVGKYYQDTLQNQRKLKPGMVFTVEPGAYFPGWGGVRIEDDIIVTAEGCEGLTSVTTELVEV